MGDKKHEGLRIIEASWNDLYDRIKMPGMTDAQREDMRALFFSGAFAMMTALETLPDDDMQQVDYILAVKAEMVEFKRTCADRLMLAMPVKGGA